MTPKNDVLKISRETLQELYDAILDADEEGLAGHAEPMQAARMILELPGAYPSTCDDAFAARYNSDPADPTVLQVLAVWREAWRAASTTVKQEPIAYQFQGRDGEWYLFQDQRHYQATLADGSWPIRPLYAHVEQFEVEKLRASQERFANHAIEARREVKRLLAENAALRKTLPNSTSELVDIRQQLAEAHALLRDWYPGCGLTARQTMALRERTDALLSAATQPTRYSEIGDSRMNEDGSVSTLVDNGDGSIGTFTRGGPKTPPVYLHADGVIRAQPAECVHQWTDNGEHLLICTECGTQEDHDPKWRDMATAPRDGTMLRLLVEFTEHQTEDADQAPTIGANNFDNDGDDRWQFAGWCWTHDHFTEGKGEPVGWLPMLDGPHHIAADGVKSDE